MFRKKVLIVADILKIPLTARRFDRQIFRRMAVVWRTRGINCGSRIAVGTNVSILNRSNLTIGSDVMLTQNILLSCSAKVVIGDRVMIGPGTILHATTHDTRTKSPIDMDISIGDDVWIAANCTVTAGVTIGCNSVVAAGAVVVKDIPDNVIVGGVPAKILKKLNPVDPSESRFVQPDWLNRFV